MNTNVKMILIQYFFYKLRWLNKKSLQPQGFLIKNH